MVTGNHTRWVPVMKTNQTNKQTTTLVFEGSAAADGLCNRLRIGQNFHSRRRQVETIEFPRPLLKFRPSANTFFFFFAFKKPLFKNGKSEIIRWGWDHILIHSIICQECLLCTKCGKFRKEPKCVQHIMRRTIIHHSLLGREVVPLGRGTTYSTMMSRNFPGTRE